MTDPRFKRLKIAVTDGKETREKQRRGGATPTDSSDNFPIKPIPETLEKIERAGSQSQSCSGGIFKNNK